MAPSRLGEGPKLDEHALCDALAAFEGCKGFLQDYGANATLACSQQRSVNYMLAKSLVRLRIPKAQSDGKRDLWLCSACGWVDFTTGCDRALYHKLGAMTKACRVFWNFRKGWLHVRTVRFSALPKRTGLVTCNSGLFLRFSLTISRARV